MTAAHDTTQPAQNEKGSLSGKGEAKAPGREMEAECADGWTDGLNQGRKLSLASRASMLGSTRA